MPALPKIKEDPTLIAMADAMEQEAQKEPPRSYLGMSSIGDPCARKLWYQWRRFADNHFGAKTLANFADGHYSEDLTAKRLRLVKDIELVTHTLEGDQIGYSDIAGHFRGHMDGEILGIYQAPKTKHVWEHKCVNPDKFRKLISLKEQLGEKEALRKWDEIYYAQAVLYMHYRKLSRHYLTVTTAGSRDWTSCRTNEDPAYAEQLIAKAEMIINATEPPAKLRDDPSYYWCNWCSFADVCHRNAPAKKGCRTCKGANPVEDGKWACTKYGVIPDEFQVKGCDEWISIV